MGKRTSFEQILETEFRWPQAGDLPFRIDKNQQYNAEIIRDMDLRFYAMIEGYRLGANCMVQAALEVEEQRNSLVFPIIFNFRQFLELSLKAQLHYFGGRVGIDANWETHDLAQLWRQFEDMLEAYGNPDPDDADEVVAAIIAEFSKIDPKSYSYRYPVDRRGQDLPVSIEQLNLDQLRDVMNAVEGYFSGCGGFFDEHVSSY